MTISPEFVVKHINKFFSLQDIKTDCSHADVLHCIHDLITNIPDELLYQPNDEYHDFLQAKYKLSEAFTIYEMQGNTTINMKVNGKHAITIIRDYLKNCPNEVTSNMYDNLNFIDDDNLKKSLLVDIKSIDDAIRNTSWKVATVFCGSAIEALLFYALGKEQKRNLTNFNSKIAMIQEKNIKNLEGKKLNELDLYEYIILAKHFNLIDESIEKHALETKNYRNLIHPGVEDRRKCSCDLDTAYIARAALHKIIKKLAR